MPCLILTEYVVLDYILTIVSIWCKNMLGNFSADICFKKQTVFRDHRSRKTLRNWRKNIRAYFCPKLRLPIVFQNISSFENWEYHSDVFTIHQDNVEMSLVTLIVVLKIFVHMFTKYHCVKKIHSPFLKSTGFQLQKVNRQLGTVQLTSHLNR